MSDNQLGANIFNKAGDPQRNAENIDAISGKKHGLLIQTKEKVRDVIETMKDSIKEKLSPYKHDKSADSNSPELPAPFHCQLREEMFK